MAQQFLHFLHASLDQFVEKYALRYIRLLVRFLTRHRFDDNIKISTWALYLISNFFNYTR